MLVDDIERHTRHWNCNKRQNYPQTHASIFHNCNNVFFFSFTYLFTNLTTFFLFKTAILICAREQEGIKDKTIYVPAPVLENMSHAVTISRVINSALREWRVSLIVVLLLLSLLISFIGEYQNWFPMCTYCCMSTIRQHHWDIVHLFQIGTSIINNITDAT